MDRTKEVCPESKRGNYRNDVRAKDKEHQEGHRSEKLRVSQFPEVSGDGSVLDGERLPELGAGAYHNFEGVASAKILNVLMPPHSIKEREVEAGN